MGPPVAALVGSADEKVLNQALGQTASGIPYRSGVVQSSVAMPNCWS